MLVDTHAHLNFAAYKKDVKEVAARIINEEMKVINVGSQYSTSERAVDLAEKYPGIMHAAVGLHPIHLFDLEFDESEVPYKTRVEDFSALAYEKLAKRKSVVAIGETGIDYFKKPENISHEEFASKQQWTFLKELQLAKKLDLPVILHCRSSKEAPKEAYEDMLSVLKDFKYNKGVIHCFSADWEIAQQFLDLGFMISFTGIITYPKTEKLAEVVDKSPLEKIMVETDAPFLTPQAKRGERNEPMYVRYIAEKIADIRKIPYDVVESVTTQNAIEFFKL